jgi:hypothetical protein
MKRLVVRSAILALIFITAFFVTRRVMGDASNGAMPISICAAVTLLAFFLTDRMKT